MSDDSDQDHPSSRFDDHEHRMAFTDENDFEGGKWIGGEYYFEKKTREGYQQSKEEALYGVFYGSSDEEDGRGKRRSRARKEGREKDFSRPMDFVTGEKGAAATAKDEKDDQEENTADEEEDKESVASRETFRALLRAGGAVPRAASASGEGVAALGAGGNANAQFRRMVELQQEESQKKLAEVEKRKKKPKARFDADFGGFEKHTKGIGMKLLAKMGFKGRLGKEETGVTRVQEAKVRPGAIGLGYGKFKESTMLRGNREIEADLQGKTLEQLNREQGVEDEEEARRRRKKGGGGRAALSQAEREAAAGGWRKGGGAGAGKRRRGQRTVFLTAEEMLAKQKEERERKVARGEDPDAGSGDEDGRAAAALAARPQLVVDMRGPQARLLTSLDEINYAPPEEEEEGPPPLGRELLHNVDLLVALSEERLVALERRRQALRDRLLALGEDLEKAAEGCEGEGGRLGRLEAVDGILERVAATLARDPGAVTVGALVRVFATLRGNYPEEYALFRLGRLAPALAAPVLGGRLEGWDVLGDPLLAVEVLAQFKPVLTQDGLAEEEAAGALVGEGDDRGLRSGRNPLLAGEDRVAFDHLVDEHVLPRLRRALVNDWEVRSPGPAVKLLEGLRPLVAPATHGYLLTMLVLPKLAGAVAQWEPARDTVPVHEWLHPWLPLLGSKLSAVYPDVRRKLAGALAAWHPADPTALAVLRPWAGVMDEQSLGALVVKSVVPKLVGALQQLAIDPRHQRLDEWRWVACWADLVPELHFAALLEGEFFPKWLNVLYQWLLQDPDYEEVTQWYLGWKGLIPEKTAALPAIIAQLNAALDMMNQVLTNRAALGAPLRPGALENVGYLAAVERRRMEEAAAQRARADAAAARARAAEEEQRARDLRGGGGGKPQVSFKEVVEMFAESSGVSFFPKPGRWQSGKQIYSFGGVNIYLDQDVAFYESSKVAGAAWQPIALETLLAYAKNKSAAAGTST